MKNIIAFLVFLTVVLLPRLSVAAVWNCPKHGPLDEWHAKKVGGMYQCGYCQEEERKRKIQEERAAVQAMYAPPKPSKIDYDVTGKTTPIGLMIATIEKPIKADYRSFSKEDYERWLPNIRQMYYLNDRTDPKNRNRPNIIQRRNVKTLATHLVPEEEAFYDIPIKCQTNMVPEIREPFMVQDNGIAKAVYVRINQHVGQNMYIGEASYNSSSIGTDFAFLMKDDMLPDGYASYKVLFKTGQLFSYTTVLGAAKRLAVLTDDPTSGKMVPKVTKFEPVPPPMESVIEYLRNGGHLLVIRTVNVKSGTSVSQVDVLTEVYDMKKEQQQKKGSK